MEMTISPLDNRYYPEMEELSIYFSEEAWIGHRVYVEVEYFEYLITLLKERGYIPKNEIIKTRKLIESILLNGNMKKECIQQVKDIEKTTKHDIKAIEYWLRQKYKELHPDSKNDYSEYIHLGLTSQDINSVAFSIQLKLTINNIIFPTLKNLVNKILTLSDKWKSIVFLAMTHGQPAVPTLLGKEMKVFVGINDSFYLDNVDKAYSEVNYCGILVFNKFIESLNNNEFQISDLNQCNLNGIVDLYSDALKELRHLEVPIKTTIAQNLTGIKKVKNQLDEIKSANSFDLNEKIQRRRQAAANNNSGCFIATATLGSYDHSLVLELRQFRDEWILTKRWGKDFVSWYYYYGGIAAKVIEDKTVLKRMSYLFIILPLVFLARVVKK